MCIINAKCLQPNKINRIKANRSGHVYSADGLSVSIQTALLNATNRSVELIRHRLDSGSVKFTADNKLWRWGANDGADFRTEEANSLEEDN